jgi:hypothetical protein
MILNMDAWVQSNVPPPASRYPRIDDGTLVPLSRYAFPAIPGVNLPHEANEARRLDFGPNWQQGILSVQPPKVGEALPVLVPQVDVDGNERDGVRLPEITVPLATYASVVSHAKLYNMICSSYAVVHVVTQCSIGG